MTPVVVACFAFVAGVLVGGTLGVFTLALLVGGSCDAEAGEALYPRRNDPPAP